MSGDLRIYPSSSVYVRLHGTAKQKELLSPWPVVEPDHYLRWRNSAWKTPCGIADGQRNIPDLSPPAEISIFCCARGLADCYTRG